MREATTEYKIKPNFLSTGCYEVQEKSEESAKYEVPHCCSSCG